MHPQLSATTANIPWERERERLVGLCRHLTGNGVVAEDLAQETLYEAWRSRDRLHDVAGLSAWLTGIARNVCLRWQSRSFRDAAQWSMPDQFADEDMLIDPFDLVTVVEQAETRQLLERALALLPTTTHHVLREHYLFDTSFATIARHQGLAEATVKMRVHRGKQRLHQILTTTLAAEAIACGLIDRATESWHTTPLWCPRCGQRHLEGQWDFAVGTFRLRCGYCFGTTGVYVAYDSVPALFHGVASLKAGFNRVMRWVNSFYIPAIDQDGWVCDCGHFVPLMRHLPAEMPAIYRGMPPERYRQIRGLHLHCPTCDGTSSMCLTNLALYSPVAWHFWSEQRRIRTLPEQEITFGERPALLLTFQSMLATSQLDIIVARDTYAILDIY